MFHLAINVENRLKYIEFCSTRNLLVSAGSDFHGEHLSHRRNITTDTTLEDISWLESLK